MSRLFALGGQSTGALASASVFPMNIQGWFLLGLTGLISLQSKGPSRVFSGTTIWKHSFSGTQPSLWSNSHIHTWLLEKTELCCWGMVILCHSCMRAKREKGKSKMVDSVCPQLCHITHGLCRNLKHSPSKCNHVLSAFQCQTLHCSPSQCPFQSINPLSNKMLNVILI